jgi:alpha-galactosidase
MSSLRLRALACITSTSLASALLNQPCGQLPISLTLGGVQLSDVLPRMGAVSTLIQLDAQRLLNNTLYYDATTGLLLNTTCTAYSGIASDERVQAEEWIVAMGNNASVPTPPVCDLSPLNITLPDGAGANGSSSVHRFLGSSAAGTDYSGVNVSLVSASAGPPPPLLPGVRLWGPTAMRNVSTPSASACRDQCIALGALACAGAVWTANVSDVGCWLLPEVDYSTNESTFVSWIAPLQRTAFSPTGGRSSNGELPFFVTTVDGPGGNGLVVSIGWSGSWQAQVSREGDQGDTRISVSHGSADFPAGFCGGILPGELFRSMRILLVSFPADGPDGYHAGINAHRRLLVAYKLPRTTDAHGQVQLQGALVSSWSWINWPQWPSLTLEQQLWHVAAVKNSSAVEAYWLDAGWFNGGFPNGVGNWQFPNLTATVDADEFPGGTLLPLAEAAHAQPNPVLNIVWFEPERIAPGTYLAGFPEYSVPAGGPLLNLGLPDARDYMTSYLSAAVTAYGLDVLRLDFNIDPAASWAAGDAAAGNRTGVTEVAYVTGLYAMWDEILAANPGLLIDNCASGGRRIDLETVSRSVPLWRSDDVGTDTDHQVHSMGISGFVPISAGAVLDWHPYAWRSAGIVGKTISWGLEGWQALLSQPTDMELLRQAVAETQRLRPAAIYGDCYSLTPIRSDESIWAAYQYHCSGPTATGTAACTANSGFALAFRRLQALDDSLALGLHGIIAGATYNVSVFVESYAPTSPPSLVSGSALADMVLDGLLQPGQSVLLEYSCTAGC